MSSTSCTRKGATRRRIVVVALHDRISGHANRVRVLDRFFTYAKSSPEGKGNFPLRKNYRVRSCFKRNSLGKTALPLAREMLCGQRAVQQLKQTRNSITHRRNYNGAVIL